MVINGESQSIAAIVDSEGNRIYENRLINDCFKTFYTDLYCSEQTSDAPHLMEDFFAKMNLPTISEEQRSLLNGPITKEELINAIKNLQSGKSPGPDGLTCEFYKEFSSLLLEPLLEMLNHSFTTTELPQTLREANISLILKKGKCPESCASYRPIALLNVDRKLLSKIRATRLEDLLPILIREDQTGFIKGRHSTNTVRRLLNVIQAFENDSIDGLVLSMDAEKAFDRVEWSFLFYTLDKFGLGNNFLKWVRILYTNPQAAVVTNGLRSEYFPTHRGTRQGCPLSPLLFALAIEPLAEIIRATPSIHGLQLGEICHKISLYADDVIVFLSQPEISVPALIERVDWFSNFSGYKINLNKSEAMPLGSLRTIPNTMPSFPFKWSPSGFVYLGIFITPSFNQLYKANFTPLFGKVKQDLDRWTSLPISWLGRIAFIKMNVLPRLLYPIQMIPILFSNRVLKDLNSWLSSFIWNKRRPRLKMSVLQLPGSMGGLDLPNIKVYQLCAHLTAISQWIKNDVSSTWFDIESSLSKCALQDLLYFGSFKNIKEKCTNPITINALKAWRSSRCMEGRLKLTSIFTPITNNPDFLPGVMDPSFQQWRNKGLTKLGDLFNDSCLMSFDQLRTKYQLPRHDFFRFLQIRHYITKNTTLIDHREVSVIEKFLYRQPGRLSLSLFYEVLRGMTPNNTQRVKGAWERELSVTIDEETWEDVWNYAKKISICARAKAIQLRIIHRIHISPNSRHCFNPPCV